MVRLIGDVHGKYAQYKKLIAQGQPPSIQVGDMGLGFRKISGPDVGKFTQNPPHYKMKAGNHRFIRGNHDNPEECKKNSQWIADGHVENGIMFIGGATSIDIPFRVKDYSWWENEELSERSLNNLIERYQYTKPRVMITHECPESVAKILAYSAGLNKLNYKSNTRQAFEKMLQSHSPELWVFGHWHHSFDFVSGMYKTRFICLNELEYRDDLI